VVEADTFLGPGDLTAKFHQHECLDHGSRRPVGFTEASGVLAEQVRGDQVWIEAVGGTRRTGGSSWPSLACGTGSIEADYLNGEIVLFGREHGVPAPVNALLQRLANQFAADHRVLGSVIPARWPPLLAV
jgi:2-dehydropantoate 2-reductase